jgi:hypothetical protein
VTRIGLEAGPLSQWLYAGLVAAGFEVVLLETRHVKAALSAMVVKTDRKDARGIAQLLRMGWFRPAHAKQSQGCDAHMRFLAGDPKQPTMITATNSRYYVSPGAKLQDRPAPSEARAFHAYRLDHSRSGSGHPRHPGRS